MNGRVTRFEYKFEGMRKPDSFIVYPASLSAEFIQVQGNRSIARIYSDGVGWLNYKGSNSKYGVHCSPVLGAEWVTFPGDFLKLVMENRTQSGDHIGLNVYVA